MLQVKCRNREEFWVCSCVGRGKNENEKKKKFKHQKLPYTAPDNCSNHWGVGSLGNVWAFTEQGPYSTILGRVHDTVKSHPYSLSHSCKAKGEKWITHMHVRLEMLTIPCNICTHVHFCH